MLRLITCCLPGAMALKFYAYAGGGPCGGGAIHVAIVQMGAPPGDGALECWPLQFFHERRQVMEGHTGVTSSGTSIHDFRAENVVPGRHHQESGRDDGVKSYCRSVRDNKEICQPLYEGLTGAGTLIYNPDTCA